MFEVAKLFWSPFYVAAGFAVMSFGWCMWRLDDTWFALPRYALYRPTEQVWDILGPVIMVLGAILLIPRWRCMPRLLRGVQDLWVIAVGCFVFSNGWVNLNLSIEAHTAPLNTAPQMCFGVGLAMLGILRARGYLRETR